MTRIALVLVAAVLAAACATRAPAPVVDRGPPSQPAAPPVVEAPPPVEQPAPKPIPTHVVKRGETLVGIALQYGLDYRELAAWNSITNVNVIGAGQTLLLAPPGGTSTALGAGLSPTGPVATPLSGAGPPIEARPLANSSNAKVEPRGQKLPFSERTLAQLSAVEPGSAPPATPVPPIAAPTPPAVPPPMAEVERPVGTDGEDVDWMWPAKGKLVTVFSDAGKGVDIAGRKGAPVLAAASGRVVYAGAGLRGYGKLVIIKHNNTWLSAYAHNENVVVKEQQDVRKGQKIAEMGSSDADPAKVRGKDDALLHFEVRRQGKPVDPAKVMPPL
jgi:lipoprotein NlpD